MRFSVSGGQYECNCGECVRLSVDESDLPGDTRGDDESDERTTDALDAWNAQTGGEYARGESPNASRPTGVFSSENESGESGNAASSKKRAGVNYVGQAGPSARSTDSPREAKRDDRPAPVLTAPVDENGGEDE